MKIINPIKYIVQEDDSLEYEINIFRQKLMHAIEDANNNLLDEKVLYISSELDELLMRYTLRYGENDDAEDEN